MGIMGTTIMSNYSNLHSPINLQNTIGYSNVAHQGTGLSFNTDPDDKCVGYVYASKSDSTGLIRYPGVSNVTDVIPASAHIHYNNICFENSNLVNSSPGITGCPDGSVDLATNEPDPHCPYLTKVVNGRDGGYKTCRDINCELRFIDTDSSTTCPGYVFFGVGLCGTISASNMLYDSNDTGSGNTANQYSMYNTVGFQGNDWTLNSESRAIEFSSYDNCGVFGYSYPNFNNLTNSNTEIDNTSANSWGENYDLSDAGVVHVIQDDRYRTLYLGDDISKYISSVCFYDPSRPDSSNICAHTQPVNNVKVYMGGMPSCPSGQEPTGTDGLCVT